MESYWATVGSAMLGNIPELIAWAIGIVLAVIMLRRGGRGKEKLLLAGFSLMFTASLAGPIIRGIVMSWMRGYESSYLSIGRAMSLVSLPMAIVSIAGAVCLVWAFWLKFRPGRQGAE